MATIPAFDRVGSRREKLVIKERDEVVDSNAERSGTVAVDRDAIVCKNKVFLPIPLGFERFFVPGDKPIRLTVLHQILGVTATAHAVSS